MSVVNLDSQSGSSANITSELTLTTYTTAADGYISGRVLLSALNGAAAIITLKVQLLDASNNKLGVPIAFSVAKDAAADTTFAGGWGPVRVLSGQKLRVRAISSNASDTAASWTSLMDDANAPDVSASTVASVTGDVAGNVDGSVNSVASQVGVGTIADNAISVTAISGAAYTAIAAAVWNALTSGLTTVGSIGKALVSYLTNVPFVFTGANAVTITVTDSTPTDLSSASVRITQGSNSEIKQTDANGEASFSLDDGTYTISITKGGYSFTPTTISVDATHTAFTKVMTATAVVTPGAGQCTGTMLVLDETGSPEANVRITFEAIDVGDDAGLAFDSAQTTSISDAQGVVSRLFPSGAVRYRYKRGAGPWKEFTTADTEGSSFDIPSNCGNP